MTIETGDYLNTKDIYIDYPFEEVMFRRMKVDGSIYRKFYGDTEYPDPIPSDNRLYNEALLSGKEISKEDYTVGQQTLKPVLLVLAHAMHGGDRVGNLCCAECPESNIYRFEWNQLEIHWREVFQ